MSGDAPSAPPEWARRVAGEILKRPLRWSVGASRRSADEAAASGWFLGVEECAAVLGAIIPAPAGMAAAFGGPWPIFSDGSVVLAPALPVALGRAPVDGVDAEYESGPDGVWREAAGARRLLIDFADRARPPGRPFDMLWFGTAERYLVREGELEIDDLFARLRVPAPIDLLERLLVRGRRLPEELLEGLPEAVGAAPAQLEIERPVALSPGGRWRDPELFLLSRADVQKATRVGSEVAIEGVRGESAVFEIETSDDRWVLSLSQGTYPLTRIALGLSGEGLRLEATIADGIDPLAPGMRGRLVFDLRSDLVALGSAEGPRGAAV